MKFPVSDHCDIYQDYYTKIKLLRSVKSTNQISFDDQNASVGLDGGQFGRYGLIMASHEISSKPQIEKFTI